jgi:preprotein translocase subunit SecB
MAEAAETPAPNAAPEQTLVQFNIEKIYVKDLSLENPGSPRSFQMTEAPQIEVGLRTRYDTVDTNLYESVLTVTVTAKTGGKTLFLIEVSQAGVFTIKGVPAEQMQAVFGIHCPAVIFPYVRETIADATMRAGFPPVHLAPINFEMLYQQQIAQAQAQAAATQTN